VGQGTPARRAGRGQRPAPVRPARRRRLPDHAFMRRRPRNSTAESMSRLPDLATGAAPPQWHLLPGEPSTRIPPGGSGRLRPSSPELASRRSSRAPRCCP